VTRPHPDQFSLLDVRATKDNRRLSTRNPSATHTELGVIYGPSGRLIMTISIWRRVSV